MAKVIARRIKTIISTSISIEQFGFFEGRQIHEAIKVAQESLHNTKTRKLKGGVLKIDLSKAFDRVRWFYIRLPLTQLGFEVPFRNWVMSFILMVSFRVLINGFDSPFFHAERGLRQGYLLSPLLFLLVGEGLNRALSEAKNQVEFQGISISNNVWITHLLFVDDVLIFCIGLRGDTDKRHDVLELFGRATSMHINERKSSIFHLKPRGSRAESLYPSFSF